MDDYYFFSIKYHSKLSIIIKTINHFFFKDIYRLILFEKKITICKYLKF